MSPSLMVVFYSSLKGLRQWASIKIAVLSLQEWNTGGQQSFRIKTYVFCYYHVLIPSETEPIQCVCSINDNRYKAEFLFISNNFMPVTVHQHKGTNGKIYLPTTLLFQIPINLRERGTGSNQYLSTSMLSIFHISSHLAFKALNYYYHFKAKKTVSESLNKLSKVTQISKWQSQPPSFLFSLATFLKLGKSTTFVTHTHI